MAIPTSLPLSRRIFAAFLMGCLLTLACTRTGELNTTATFLPVPGSPGEYLVLSRMGLMGPTDISPNHADHTMIVLTSGTCTLAMDTQLTTSLSV